MSRRKRRYYNRQLKRKQKKEVYKQYDNLKVITNYDNIYKAIKDSTKGVKFKRSVQKVHIRSLFTVVETERNIVNKENITRGLIKFTLNEYGKKRFIQSVSIKERIIQKVICTQVLYPIVSKHVIYENSASQKGKGLSFAHNIMKKHLREYYKKYGNKGYILTIDFKSYFASIDHNKLKEVLRKYVHDKDILWFLDTFIDIYEEGIGLGAETSQLFAILYTTEIDNYIKSKFKYYSRYMDDSNIIHFSREDLIDCLKIIKEMCKEYHIKVNELKTQIRDLPHGFTYLQTRYHLLPMGRLLELPRRENLTKQRRKLKRMTKLLERNIINFEEYKTGFVSWYGSMSKRTCRRSLYNFKLKYIEAERTYDDFNRRKAV